MPRKPKERHFSADMHILVRPDQYEFVRSLNGGIGHHVRSFIDVQMGKHDKDLAEVNKQFAVIEPQYLALKRMKEVLEEKKRQEMTATMEKEKSIEFAHMKLLESYKGHYKRIDLMPENVFKFYSDQCGLPADTLKEWLRREIANV
ncbi:MAG: hypothetical protein Q8S44_01245 [Flavobacteriaceae bacterium]|nr:hypothetical protein [Flavobacteriaceae bacterium]